MKEFRLYAETPHARSMGPPNARPFLSREEWLAKRQARRERQREQNVIRAAQTREARLDRGPQPERQNAAKLSEFYVGCSGWYYWHWRGRLYPPGAQTNDWFKHYARSFNTVELNAPFYAWPTVRTVETWKRQRGQRRLLYTVKVNELITHTRRFSRTADLVKDFALIADLLGPVMGCFLFQLPPSFKYSPARLKRITDQLDPRHRNVVEFRHKSWWNAKVYAAFRERGIIFCSCSGPRLPDELVTTASDVYIRFHGRKRWPPGFGLTSIMTGRDTRSRTQRRFCACCANAPSWPARAMCNWGRTMATRPALVP